VRVVRPWQVFAGIVLFTTLVFTLTELPTQRGECIKNCQYPRSIGLYDNQMESQCTSQCNEGFDNINLILIVSFLVGVVILVAIIAFFPGKKGEHLTLESVMKAHPDLWPEENKVNEPESPETTHDDDETGKTD